MANEKLPYRLQVLQRLTRHLEGVNPLNGYSFNLSRSVFRSDIEFGEESPDTMLVILENPRADYGTFAGSDQGRSEGWVLMLQGTTKLDKGPHTLDPLYYMAEAVENRLISLIAVRDNGNPAFPDDYMLGRQPNGQTLISSLEIGPPVVRPAPNATSKAFFYMHLRVGLSVVFG